MPTEPTTASVIDAWKTERRDLLHQNAAAYAEVALANIEREFPHDGRYFQNGPGPLPRPRERHPAFYGSFDWHSCVEMHWTLARLLRLTPGNLPRERVRAALNEHLATEPLAAEAAYFADPHNGPHPPPYGWGWSLMLAHETAAAPDPDARRWAANLTPLARICVDRYLRWLPRATYPVRHGMHTNSAFGLSRALPHADGDPTLRAAITETAHRWFDDDTDYPGRYEPSGIDFLSPALTEAELMACLLDPEPFATWLDRFLPHLTDREPATLFTPATVSDPTDGLIAHLHGLNLSRAWCWQRVAESLPAGDPRVPTLIDAARHHTQAALPHVVGDDYMVEHWLLCYAVLLLT